MVQTQMTSIKYESDIYLSICVPNQIVSVWYQPYPKSTVLDGMVSVRVEYMSTNHRKKRPSPTRHFLIKELRRPPSLEPNLTPGLRLLFTKQKEQEKGKF
jgi:hypothetical protein